MRTGVGGKRLNFSDSCVNIAARASPSAGHRRHDSVSGSGTGATRLAPSRGGWIVWGDEERRKTGRHRPTRDRGTSSRIGWRVSELVYDNDAPGNILITKDWRLVMIDFTRAFRPWKETRNPLTILRRCDRQLLATMRGLTKPALQKAVGDYLSSHAVDALLARRDAIVAHFDALVAQLGEGKVLY